MENWVGVQSFVAVDRKVENRADRRDLHLWAGIIFSGFVSQFLGGMGLESWTASTLQKRPFAIRCLRGRLPLWLLIFLFLLFWTFGVWASDEEVSLVYPRC